MRRTPPRAAPPTASPWRSSSRTVPPRTSAGSGWRCPPTTVPPGSPRRSRAGATAATRCPCATRQRATCPRASRQQDTNGSTIEQTLIKAYAVRCPHGGLFLTAPLAQGTSLCQGHTILCHQSEFLTASGEIRARLAGEKRRAVRVERVVRPAWSRAVRSPPAPSGISRAHFGELLIYLARDARWHRIRPTRDERRGPQTGFWRRKRTTAGFHRPLRRHPRPWVDRVSVRGPDRTDRRGPLPLPRRDPWHEAPARRAGYRRPRPPRPARPHPG